MTAKNIQPIKPVAPTQAKDAADKTSGSGPYRLSATSGLGKGAMSPFISQPTGSQRQEKVMNTFSRITQARPGMRAALTAPVAAFAALALVLSFANPTGAGHSSVSSNGSKNDRNATIGTSDGPASHTPTGLPSASSHAKRYAGPAQLAPTPRDHQNKEAEAANGEGQNPYSTRQVLYHGNAVQSAPRIYLVLWGTSWTTSSGDPYGVAARLHYFYSGIGGSSVANVLKQYGGSTGAFTNPGSQYRGWLRDNSVVPAQPTKAQVAAVAARAATAMGDYSNNAQFVVAMPWGVVDQYSTANSFCGWHSWVSAGSGWVTYTALSYGPYLDRLGRGCGGYKVNGSNGILDGVTILASHEYAETVNDPGLNAWYDADGDENADKCSWKNLANKQLTNGYVLPVQPSWSNTYRTQYGNGCLYSS